MRYLNILKQILYLMVFVILIIFFDQLFKTNIIEGFVYLFIILIFILLRLTLFRKSLEYKNIKENHIWIGIGYAIGFLLLFASIIASLGTFEDLKNLHSIPLWAILLLAFGWTFGILLTFFSYLSKKEMRYIKPVKENRSRLDKSRKTGVNYLMAFLIVLILSEFIFKIIAFTLINVIINFLVLLIVYLSLRMFNL